MGRLADPVGKLNLQRQDLGVSLSELPYIRRMKIEVLILALAACFPLQAQVIPGSADGKTGSRIWFSSYSVNADGTLGKAVGNYQAEVLKAELGQRYLAVIQSEDWTNAARQYPTNLPLYEAPDTVAVQVVLNYAKRQFEFYSWDANSFSGKPHHVSPVLHFMGNDNKPYAISFVEFMGK